MQEGDVKRVDVIEADHVLAAMQELGWVPGERPPPLAAIQAKLRQRFKNGGHTNRLSRLREEAKVLAGSDTGESEATPAEAAEVAPLPEALEQRLSGWAAGVGGFLTSLHSDLASYLATYRSGVDRDASERIEAAVRSATKGIAAAESEMEIALQAYSDSADKIADLTTALSESQSAAAAAAGKTGAMADQLTAVRSQLSEAETAINAAREVAATATGKTDALDRELTARTKRLTDVEAELILTQTALATTGGKLQVVEGELAARDERLNNLYEQIEVLSTAAAKAKGRAEAVEHELDARTITLAEVEKNLITALAANAAAASKAEMLEDEIFRLRERIGVLEGSQTLAPVKQRTEPLKQGAALKPGRRNEPGGEV